MQHQPPVPPTSTPTPPWHDSSPTLRQTLTVLAADARSAGWEFELVDAGLSVTHPVTRSHARISAEEFLKDPTWAASQVRVLLAISQRDLDDTQRRRRAAPERRGDVAARRDWVIEPTWPGPWTSPFSGQDMVERSG